MSVKKNELVDNFSFLDLLRAYYDCRRNKRRTISALQFELNMESNLIQLYHDLKSGKYKIGRSICFVVTKPKFREVWAANFRDRIVHHLIYNAISKRFYKRFIRDTYSCIPQRGTLSAAKQLAKYTRSVTCNYKKKAYYLKADLSNFFVSINKDILYNLLSRYVKEEWILKLLLQVIYSNPKNNVFIKSKKQLFKKLPKHKSLWHTPDVKGLPIGNLTSQFFSNVYLDVMDKYIKEKLHCKYYCRYVDDFIILADSPKFLCECMYKIAEYIKENLHLELCPKKCYINSIIKGIDFVGYEIKPNRMFIRKNIIRRVFRAIKDWKNEYNRFEETRLNEFYVSMNSYLGMMRHLDSYKIRSKICNAVRSLFIYDNFEFSKMMLAY